ncbi:Rv1733c family protein [Nocardia sp. CA-107356]|uniref:Rv1733c family protein n=1 Tax=Nocardia sp. CA-107356 TaxID=3239972 RepID=UPI003D8DBEB2
MSESPALPVRIWRMQPWNPSPLMRVSDRMQGITRILAVLIVLVAVPIAAAAGTAAYATASARIRTENASKVAVTAFITGNPVRVAAPVADRNGAMVEHFQAQVSWTNDGKSATAIVGVPDSAQPGQPAPVWLGPDGRPTTAPQRSSTAAVHGISVGAAVLLEIWLGAAAFLCATAWALDHHRNNGWDREWRQITHPTGQGSQ